MPKRNVFISYRFHDLSYKAHVDALFDELPHRNYSLSILDRTNQEVANAIYRRSWSCSIIVLLVGAETNKSDWILRELLEYGKSDASLQHTSTRRVRRPKGLLAVMLPGGPHTVPASAQSRILEQTAVRIDWNDLDSAATLDRYLHEAYAVRPK